MHCRRHLKEEAKLWPQPENLVERAASLIIDRRARKKIETDNNVYRTSEIYGTDSTEHTPSLRKAAFDRVAKLTTPVVNHVEAGISDDAGVENALRIFNGPEIPGNTSQRQLFDRIGNRWGFITGKAMPTRFLRWMNEGQVPESGREYKEQAANINAAPMKLGNKEHKQTGVNLVDEMRASV